MGPFEERLQVVHNHFKNRDVSPGYRALIDCVLDTASTEMYEQCIALTDWKEENPDQEVELINRSLQLLEQLATISVTPAEETILLSASEISKTYSHKRFALNNVSFAVRSGEVLGLVGENGNGKTTVLRILAGELRYDSGELNYPFDKGNSSTYDLGTKLIYIPQRTPRWFGSLKDNLKYAAAHYGTKGKENELLCDMMILRFGLWKYRNFKWDELSSGYKMRFELARTFLRKPKILLLDEPLANLDIVSQQLILSDLKNLSQSVSSPLGIVLSSQQLFEVEKISDKILYLKNGSPTHLAEKNEEEKNLSYIELEIECEREMLMKYISHLQLRKLQFNAGTYLICVEHSDGFNMVLSALIQNNVKISFARDISKSTKRLFM